MRLLRAYAALFLAIVAAFRTPRVHALLTIFLLMAVVQAFVFSHVEDWGLLDSFYFVVVSMATVGYGDFAPHTSLGKICTIAFLPMGIGVFVLLVSSIAEAMLREVRLVERQDHGRAKPHASDTRPE